MKYDPSMYIGIGKDGFLPPDNWEPDEDHSWVGSYGSERPRGGIASWIAFTVIFGGVATWIGYSFLST